MCLAWTCLSAGWLVRAQAPPPVAWQWTLGGISNDVLFYVEELPQGGFLLCGYSSSPVGPGKTGILYGGADYWVTRLDGQGAVVWDKTYGGVSDDFLSSGQRTADGGILLGGTSLSEAGGNKEADTFGLRDYWVVRLDEQGTKLWDRAYGGTSSDYLQAIKPATNQTFLLGGYSFSTMTGNKSTPGFGFFDFWLVAVEADGTKLWDKDFGGGNNDYLTCLEATGDGGWLAAGYSFSGPGGNKTSANLGGADYWVVRLDGSGNKLWDATYGGSGTEVLREVRASGDGGFFLAGQSTSEAGGSKSSPNYGGTDYWLVRIDGNGTKLWDQSYGGSGSDQLWSFIPGPEGTLVMGGWSDSIQDGTKTGPSFGLSDFWIVSADGQGNQRWDRTVGGNHDEVALFLDLTLDGGILAAGYSFSDASGTKTTSNVGEGDYWIVKLEASGVPILVGALPQSAEMLGGQGFRFFLSGPTNRRYVLEYSTNFVQWLTFQTNTLTARELLILDTKATNQQRRFYRAVLEEEAQ